MASWLRSGWALLVIALLVVFGLGLANLAVFHAWAGGGPPSPNPEWHKQWAGRFLAAMCACFGTALYLGVQRRRARRAG
jgi:hypothetical protein